MSGQVPVRVDVAGAFAGLARDLQRAGATGLRRELYKGLQRSARPLKPAVLASASATLPSTGGRGRRRTRLVGTGETLVNRVSGREHAIKRKVSLAGRLAPPESVVDRVTAATFRTAVSKSGTPRVRFSATEKRGRRMDLYALDGGRLRHPLFGKRRWWYSQAVTPGWFTKPIEGKASDFERELKRAVDDLTDQINRA